MRPEPRAKSSPRDEPLYIGRYALFDVIAAGGMAKVHYGRFSGAAGFARTVAIKRMHPAIAHDAEFRDMFVDEARLAARIRHPNVVQTLDIVAEDDELFVVMEYLHGESFSKLWREAARRAVPIPVGVAVNIAICALHGLHAAHEATDERGRPLELVHRDVSPHNILVGADGAVRVMDFGIAKAAGRLHNTSTQEGKIKGKIAYMAPEQMSGDAVDRRTDVYAASVVLWEALTGRRMFDGDSEVVVMKNALRGCTTTPASLMPGLAPAISEITMRGLSEEPSKRFSTALEMATALEATGLVAMPSAVAGWVRELGGPVLERRTKYVAEIEQVELEGTGPLPAARVSREVVTGPHSEIPTQSARRVHSMPPQDGTLGTSARTNGSDLSKRASRPYVAIAVIGAVVAIGGFGLLRLRGSSAKIADTTAAGMSGTHDAPPLSPVPVFNSPAAIADPAPDETAAAPSASERPLPVTSARKFFGPPIKPAVSAAPPPHAPVVSACDPHDISCDPTKYGQH